MNPVGGPNPILVRYFAGQESLDAAATEYVRICREWLEASEAQRRQMVTNLQRQPSSSDVPPIPRLNNADLPKIRALMERVEAKLDLINTQAREYLSSAGDSAFDQTVRLLANDVRATLGDQYIAVVWSFAAQIRKFFAGQDPASKCVDDVQQYFQDTFVDTSWPACPRHPNHPLEFEDGSWHCPRDRSVVARLGELSRSRDRPA
jgi:hypothetical protein